jgi:cation:H+ antiporter
LIFIELIFYSALIVFAGWRLTRDGDILGEKLQMGRLWVGVVLLSAITSLPEFVTTAASALSGKPEFILGNVFGSNLFNLFGIVFIDFLYKDKSLFAELNQGHRPSIYAAGMLMFLVLIDMLSYHFMQQPLVPMGNYSLTTLLIPVAFLTFSYWSSHSQKQNFAEEPDQELLYGQVSTRWVVFTFLAAAAVVVFGGIKLIAVADEVAVYPFPIVGEIGRTRVGLILLAIVTSLPEMVVCASALKLGAIDMAVGNILGSNIFNLNILSVGDLCLRRHVLGEGGGIDLYTLCLGLFVSVIVLICFSHPSRRRWGPLGVNSLIVFILLALGYIPIVLFG